FKFGTTRVLSGESRRLLVSDSQGEWFLLEVDRSKGIVSRPIGLAPDQKYVSFSPNGTMVCAWDDRGEAQLWGVRDGRPARKTLSHSGAIREALFSPDERRLLTLCEDSTRVWDTESCELICGPRAHDSAVSLLAFGADSTSFLTCHVVGTIRIWDSSSHEP